MARIPFFLTLLCLSLSVFAVSSSKCKVGKRAGTTAALEARTCENEDGEDGSGGCDPCDDKCETNKRSLEDEDISVRTIYGNATVPWEEGETVRWHILSARQNKQLVFNCKRIPDICQNMCFGIECANPKLPSTLTKSSDTKTCRDARKRNTCGATNPNRCSAKFPGNAGKIKDMSCDEYPFASTREGQTLQAVTRCVPKEQNSSQGGQISGLYKKITQGTQFDVRFDFKGDGQGALPGAPGATGYCAANRICALSGYQKDQ
ncbi:deoxyribonuclease NucA/NucB-domain-containing protein [Rhodofomes roseus]|uniref:Deoxyribonuclease NucA/NucB-domain-containing protein n=1 Tax=Rhodofomes roseus TaxID=34475 RepID=A0ABQ8KJ82_9APHY|nr:deoxyribonuclease NucA/NucB-domain-containing protein [Rhodofomes roseus]KAH9837852.1 deoxyribonuclease NucA/NucB-domain-containing protein [Rhodofomes roseus]